MCRTSAPPRRDLYELGQSLTADPAKSTTTEDPQGSFSLPSPGRRWAYLGTETHYGYTYHLWQNEATKKRFAWDVNKYRHATTKEQR